MRMTLKKWIMAFLILSMVLLVGFAAFQYAADPLLQFRPESGFLTAYKYLDIYSNPGIARQYEYDAVMVGTSMIENTVVPECNELFDCNMVRLSYSGGSAYNMKRILDICFDREQTPKTVFWSLDEHQIISGWDQPRYPLPEYLYDQTLEGNLSYLLNLDIFYNFTYPDILMTRNGVHQKAAPEGESWSGDFSKAAMMHSYDRPAQADELVGLTHFQETVQENLDNNILPLIRENPETEFKFIFVPYSILYWDKEMRQGTFDALMYSVEHTVKTLLQYDNVHVYFYHDWWDVVLNLDNYKDYSHYGKWINSAIMQRVAQGEGELTDENYVQKFKEMSEFIHSYDFENLFADEK